MQFSRSVTPLMRFVYLLFLLLISIAPLLLIVQTTRIGMPLIAGALAVVQYFFLRSPFMRPFWPSFQLFWHHRRLEPKDITLDNTPLPPELQKAHETLHGLGFQRLGEYVDPMTVLLPGLLYNPIKWIFANEDKTLLAELHHIQVEGETYAGVAFQSRFADAFLLETIYPSDEFVNTPTYSSFGVLESLQSAYRTHQERLLILDDERGEPQAFPSMAALLDDERAYRETQGIANPRAGLVRFVVILAALSGIISAITVLLLGLGRQVLAVFVALGEVDAQGQTTLLYLAVGIVLVSAISLFVIQRRTGGSAHGSARIPQS